MGEEELRARQILLAMQERLARDPYEAFSLIGSATAADIRRAFLTMTKQFHPARFGRMSNDIQRLANEVFLSLRAAHEVLARPTVKQPGPHAGVRLASPTPHAGVRTTATPRALGAQASQPLRPTPSPVSRVDGTRPLRMPSASPPPPPSRPPTGAPVARRASTQGASTARPTGRIESQAGSGSPADRELAPILELMKQGHVVAAKAALEALVQKSPDSARHRALLAYARGREAQLDQRVDEARGEFLDALDLDPDLQLANTALAELFTRRR